MIRHRTTPWAAGIGPRSIASTRAARWVAFRSDGFPGAFTRKYSVAEAFGYLKDKCSIWVAQNVNASCAISGAGYFVSTVGRDEEMIRAYIRNEKLADKQLDQMQLRLGSS